MTATDEVEPTPPGARRRMIAHRVLSITTWTFCAALAWTSVSYCLGLTWPAHVTVLLQGLFPLVFLPAYLILPVVVWHRRVALSAVIASLVVVHLLVVLPVARGDAVPAWAAAAPRLSILSANVYDRNPRPDDAARALMARDVDVLVVIEQTPRLEAALRRAGVDARYPYKLVGDPVATGESVEAIYSKIPFIHHSEVPTGRQSMHAVTLDVGGVEMEIVSVHIDSAVRNRHEWIAELEDLAEHARTVTMPMVMVGDYNATRWNPPFDDLLDAGLTDAHEARWKGLTFSWPNNRVPFAVLRLDHALTNRRATVVAIHDVDIPGSDHKAFLAEVAVRG